MMMPSPSEIKFDSMLDIIDYTAKGMVPKKKDFDEVMIHLRQPDRVPRESDTDEVYISADIVPETDEQRELVACVLERVYEDRRKNRRNLLITAGVITALVLGGHIFLFARRHKKEKDELEAYRSLYPRVDLTCETISVDCEDL